MPPGNRTMRVDAMPPCCLDALADGDADGLTQLYVDPRVRAFLGGPLDLATAQQRIAALLADRANTWVRAVRAAAGAPLAGLVMLDPHHDGEDLEISYLLLPAFWGCGLATAAVAQMRQDAFQTLGLGQVVAETQVANAASIRLLQRLGFSEARRVTRFGAEQCIFVSHAADLRTA